MRAEEEHELHILSVSCEYIEKILATQIFALTPKALSTKISEAERLPILGGISELNSMISRLKGRKETLLRTKQQEATHND